MFSLREFENELSQSLQAGQVSGCMFCSVEPSLIVEQTDSLMLIRDKFPVVPGHFMIISKGHFGCMGELPFSTFREIEYLRKKVMIYLGTKKLIGYEHGRAGHCVKLKGSQVTCHHFHLHYLPLKVDIRSKLEIRFSPKQTKTLSDVRDFFERHGEYLYFETVEGKGYFYPASIEVEPHLLRTLVCESAGHANRSDWENL